MIDHNHFICHFIFGGHLLNIPVIISTKINAVTGGGIFPLVGHGILLSYLLFISVNCLGSVLLLNILAQFFPAFKPFVKIIHLETFLDQ